MKLAIIGTSYGILEQLHDKYFVRKISEHTEELSQPRFYKYAGKALGIIFLHFETIELMDNFCENHNKLIKIILEKQADYDGQYQN